MGNSPSCDAFADMTKYNRVNNIQVWDPLTFDVWVVTENYIRTKETTELNRELGLYSINKIGNTNGFKTNK